MPGKRRGRSKGQGTIFKRMLRGQFVGWAGMLDMGIVAGKRKRKAFYGSTEAEVRDKLDEARSKLKAGKLGKAGRLTTGHWLTEWLETLRKQVGHDDAIRPKTFRHYEQLTRSYLIPALGPIPLEKLATIDVRRMLDECKERGVRKELSPRSRVHLRAVLRNALNAAMRDGLISQNAAAERKLATAKKRRVEPLTPAQASALFESLKGDRLEGLYVTALGLALRQGEALGLRWQDIDLDAGWLHVRWQLQRIDGEFRLVEPKTDESRRRLPLPAFVAQALRDHQERQRREREALGARWLERHGLVFTTAYGAPLHGTFVTKSLQRHLAAAGLPKKRFQDLRHSGASVLIAKKMPAKWVSGLLGHTTIRTTMDIYGHLYDEGMIESAAAMNDVLGGK